MNIHILVISTGAVFFSPRDRNQRKETLQHIIDVLTFSKAPQVSYFDFSDLCPVWVVEQLRGETHGG